MLADGYHICVTKLVAYDRPAINSGAVDALQVFEKEDGLNLHDPRMMSRDDGIYDRDGIVGLPTDRQYFIGPFDLREPFP